MTRRAVPLCSAWFLYWGRQFGMSKAEALHTPLGEVLDMLSCHAIANGANPKRKNITTFDDALKVR